MLLTYRTFCHMYRVIKYFLLFGLHKLTNTLSFLLFIVPYILMNNLKRSHLFPNIYNSGMVLKPNIFAITNVFFFLFSYQQKYMFHIRWTDKRSWGIIYYRLLSSKVRIKSKINILFNCLYIFDFQVFGFESFWCSIIKKCFERIDCKQCCFQFPKFR